MPAIVTPPDRAPPSPPPSPPPCRRRARREARAAGPCRRARGIIPRMSLSVVFVLVGTTHPGNVGAAARAMKTMGFAQMRLVDACDHRDPEAIARASGADDVLARAATHATLAAAVADCRAVVRRQCPAPASLSVPMLDSARGLRDAGRSRRAGRVGAGGRRRGRRARPCCSASERSGLDQRGAGPVHSPPAHPQRSGVQLAEPGQRRCRSWPTSWHRRASDADPPTSPTAGLSKRLSGRPSGDPQGAPRRASAASPERPSRRADGAAMEHLFAHLERVMLETGFLDPEQPASADAPARARLLRAQPPRATTSWPFCAASSSATERPEAPRFRPERG